MLVVTSSVRVLDWIHGTTSHLWPAVPFYTVLMEVIASLEHWLIHAASASDDAHNCTARGRDALASARWQANTSLAAVIRVAHDHAGRATSPGKAPTVSCLLLAHGDH